MDPRRIGGGADGSNRMFSSGEGGDTSDTTMVSSTTDRRATPSQGVVGFASSSGVPDPTPTLGGTTRPDESTHTQPWDAAGPSRSGTATGIGHGSESGTGTGTGTGTGKGKRAALTSPERSKSKVGRLSISSAPGEKKDDGKDGSGSGSKGGGGGGGGGDSATARRAAQACLRCRKQKLRCLGGWPCKRCQKSKNVCDFGRPGPGYNTGAPRDEANARLEQLESSVANLLAGLAGGPGGTSGPYPNGEIMHTFDPTGHAQAGSFSSTDGQQPPQHIPPSSWATSHLPPPTHVRPMDPPRFPGAPGVQPSVSPDDGQHVRFGSSPQVSFIAGQPMTSPSNYSSGISPASAGFKDGSVAGTAGGVSEKRKEKKVGKGQKAEERLAAVTEGAFDPPFKALVYQPAVWDNREQSRRNSPQPSAGTMSRDELSGNTYERRFGRERDDPVNTGLVDLAMAETLFSFFIDHCHPFLPIVNVALDDAFTTIRQSPPLISAMIAIAARFYVRFTTRSMSSYPALDPSIPPRLANLAETHLGQTLLRKQHALSDVQAILLLAAWGLQSGGRGPDAWIVTGHAARVARRLGVHKVLAQAAETARVTQPGTEEWSKLEGFMPQWRSWLCWFCFDGFLSLGFGRPQSTQFETVDEQGFLQLRLNQTLPRPGSTQSTSLYGDVYIAGQVQLTQIGRDLINWGEMLSDPEKAILADPRRASMMHNRELSVTTMFRELNARLDEWSRLWVWAGSPYTLYLGSSARIARLQAEHMRLCLNSYALKSAPEEDELIALCLKKALNAAMSTIQTHYESSQTDLALSFATDYLTITLAQAAVFLIRLTKAPISVQQVINVDPSVVAHYLKMSVDLLESADMSETRLSTYLAKTIRDISRAAGIVVPGISPIDYEDPSAVDSRPHTATSYPHPPALDALLAQGNGSDGANVTEGGTTTMSHTQSNGNGNGEIFDLENFLQVESQLDLGYLLGLPGDNSAAVQGGNGWTFGGNEFEFGLGGLGMGQGMNLDGF